MSYPEIHCPRQKAPRSILAGVDTDDRHFSRPLTAPTINRKVSGRGRSDDEFRVSPRTFSYIFAGAGRMYISGHYRRGSAGVLISLKDHIIWLVLFFFTTIVE